MSEEAIATAPLLEAMTFSRFPEFLKQEAAAGRLEQTPAKGYATAYRRLLEYFPEMADVQVTVAEADQVAEAVKGADSDLAKDTLSQYAAKIRKAARYWFESKTRRIEPSSSPLVEHSLQLRPDLAIRLALPHDLTAVESAFICHYIQRLRGPASEVVPAAAAPLPAFDFHEEAKRR